MSGFCTRCTSDNDWKVGELFWELFVVQVPLERSHKSLCYDHTGLVHNRPTCHPPPPAPTPHPPSTAGHHHRVEMMTMVIMAMMKMLKSVIKMRRSKKKLLMLEDDSQNVLSKQHMTMHDIFI